LTARSASPDAKPRTTRLFSTVSQTDRASLPFSKEAIARMAEAGIVQGGSGEKFEPKANASRAQSVAMLKRMLQYCGFINE
jgi:hypothetical protein